MKKVKIFSFAIIFCFGLLIFGACGNKSDVTILAKSITLSETDISLVLGESKTIDVSISPDDATKKDFEVVYTREDAKVVSVEYKKEDMQFVLTATDEIVDGNDSCIIDVRATDGSGVHQVAYIQIIQSEANVETPKNLTFDGSDLVWSEVNNANGYIVNIDGVDMPIVYTNSYHISTVGKQITAKVKAVGESNSKDSAYTPEIVFTILSAPTNVKYTNGLLQWNAVEGSSKYEIYFDGKLFSVENSTQFDLLNRFSESKTYEIKVKAIGNFDLSTFDSEYSTAVNVTKLAVPENFMIRQSIAMWSTVVGSEKYEIVLDKGLDTEINWTVNSGTQYILPKDLVAGAHTICVRAVGNGRNILSSDLSSSLKFTKLSSVENLRIENGQIAWDKNALATSYTLYINGEARTTSNAEQLTYALSDYGSGSYNINICANGDGVNTIASNQAEKSLNVAKLESPTGLAASREQNGNKFVNKISWNAVPSATGYVLSIEHEDENQQIQLASTATSYQITEDYKVGVYKFNVKALGVDGGVDDTNVYISSNFGEKFLSVEKLDKPALLKVENGVVTWDKVSPKLVKNIKGYQLLINGNEEVLIEAIQNTFDFAGINYPAGDYTICIKVLGNEAETIDGDYTETITVSKLGTPDLLVVDGKIASANVVNADKIEYQLTRANGTSKLYDSAISSFVGTDNEEVSIVARALAGEGTSFINGDVSQKLVVRQLPKIRDIELANGILSYGKTSYANISTGVDFHLSVTKDGEESQSINNGTAINYNFNSVDAGKYRVTIKALSRLNGKTTFDEQGNATAIPFLNSIVSEEFSFARLACPENLHITSPADDYKTLGELLANIGGMKTWPGQIAWDKVDGAVSYTISLNGAEYANFTNSMTTLQDKSIDAGDYFLKVKAIGDGTTTISSEYCETISIKKLKAPTNLRVENGELVWDSDYNKDLSNTLGMPMWITSATKNAILYVAVINDSQYITLDTDGLSVSTITDSLKLNKFELPNLATSKCSVRIYAMPMNAYASNFKISDYQSSEVGKPNDIYVMSECSIDSVNLESLDTPTNLAMNKVGSDQVLSWSPLKYEKGVRGYRIVVGYNKKEFIKDIEGVDITQKDNCKWIFNKANFEAISAGEAFGSGAYTFKVRALANDDSNVDDAGKPFKYVNSYYSKEIMSTILETPAIKLEKGVVTWNEISGVELYEITIDGSKVVTTDKLKLDFGKEYASGTHTFKIRAIGDGSDYITSDQSENYEFIKLATITNVKISGGIVVYNSNGIVDDGSNSCVYAIVVNGKTYENAKATKFEVDDRFEGNKEYEIYVIAQGDNSKYISSDTSDKCASKLNNPFKLKTPNNLRIENGKLMWDAVPNASGYRIYVSGKLEQTSDSVATSYDFVGLEAGSYYIQVKAIGNELSYLNSSYTKKTTYTKQSGISNFQATNGVLTWDKITATTQNKLTLVIKPQNGTAQEYVLSETEMKNCKFELGENFSAGTYQIYMYNAGGTNAISSEKTETKTFVKLEALSNLAVVSKEDGQYVTFDTLANAGGYVLKVVSGKNTKEIDLGLDNEIRVEASTTSLDGGFIVEEENGKKILQISSSGTYTISAKAIGSGSSFLSSNYSNSSVITQPETPKIEEVLTSNNQFSGKIIWDAVEYADFYTVYITKSVDGVVQKSYTQKVEVTEFYISEKGSYNIKVTACKDTNGFDSGYSNELNVDYTLYEGSGTEADPYKIIDLNDYKNIKYNLTAHYKLTKNIAMLNQTIETIGSSSEKFDGTLDGAGFALEDLSVESNTNFFGLFYALGTNGVIKNLTLTNLNVAGAEILGGLVAENYGTISNCVVKGKILTKLNNANKLIYNGGIAGKNYGTIELCMNFAEVSPTNSQNFVYAGGIVALNAGTVQTSGNYGTIGANTSGGIVALNETKGIIKECYNEGDATINAYSFSSQQKTMYAFAGGIVANSKSTDTITYCYNKGKVVASNEYSNAGAYAGGIVGYNDGTTIKYCYSINGTKASDQFISVKISGSAPAGYVGILVGYNNAGTLKSNVYVYTNSTQKGVSNVSNVNGGLDVSRILKGTILSSLGGGSSYYVSSDDYPLYPRLRNAKY